MRHTHSMFSSHAARVGGATIGVRHEHRAASAIGENMSEVDTGVVYQPSVGALGVDHCMPAYVGDSMYDQLGTSPGYGSVRIGARPNAHVMMAPRTARNNPFVRAPRTPTSPLGINDRVHVVGTRRVSALASPDTRLYPTGEVSFGKGASTTRATHTLRSVAPRARAPSRGAPPRVGSSDSRRHNTSSSRIRSSGRSRSASSTRRGSSRQRAVGSSRAAPARAQSLGTGSKRIVAM